MSCRFRQAINWWNIVLDSVSNMTEKEKMLAGLIYDANVHAPRISATIITICAHRTTMHSRP